MNSLPERLSSKLWFGYLCFLLFWAFDAYAEIGRFMREGTLFARVLDGKPFINDTVQWYNAAVLAHRCAGGTFNIYDPEIQDRSMRAITQPVVPEAYLYLQYPPQFFPLVEPFARFPIGQAYFVWCGIALVLISICLWFVIKDAAKEKFARAFMFIGTLASFPAWLSFELAQTSLFQFPATMAFWLFMRAGKFFLAGLVMTLLLVKVQYSPALLLIGLLLGRLRYAAGLTVSCVFLTIITVLNVGIENIKRFPEALAFGETSNKVAGVGAEQMQNFRGELVVLLGQDGRVIHLTVLALFGLGVATIGWLWWRVYPRLSEKLGRQAFNILAACSVLISLITSPHTHIQEFLSASLALLFLYPLVAGARKTRAEKTLYGLMIAYPALSWIFFLGKIVFFLLRMQPFLIWTLAVLFCVYRIVGERTRGDRASDPDPVSNTDAKPVSDS
ncbi:MAG TPA: glycosyltransferase family 87 protein [Chroococcales cyanobacterium]